jgi:hypothetical protein
VWHNKRYFIFSKDEIFMKQEQKIKRLMLGVLFLLTTLSMLGCGGKSADEAKASKQGVVVTSETFVRADTDRVFHDIVQLAGGLNKFFHHRNVTPIEHQTVVRMNRDTLYSASVVDTSQGATITLPAMPDGRYISAHVLDNDHFTIDIFHAPGTHILQAETQYVAVNIRIQAFNPDDKDELALIHSLQDQIIINANSAEPLPAFKWDRASYKKLHALFQQDYSKIPSNKGLMGARSVPVGDFERNAMAAGAWGLLPDAEAVYLTYAPSTPFTPNTVYTATYTVPENDAFWSITVYNADGFMFSEASIVNSSNVTLNPDGTFTVYFGSAEQVGDRPNRLDITEGWNFQMRVYRPGESVLNGSYILPEVMPVG